MAYLGSAHGIDQLDPNQQNLLRTAIASNRPGPSSDSMVFTKPFGAPFLAAQADYSNLEIDTLSFPDYIGNESSFDFDSSNLAGIDPDDLEVKDSHDKRKMSDADPEDDEDDEHGEYKRREGDDKQSKKPGRKPVTAEPTTKRKAQNRAAQRAFRERKEKHLKDLETKVTELTKTTETEKQENGVLRAQVARLQAELKDYRRRLTEDAGKNRSPPTLAALAPTEYAFDFPSFNTIPPPTRQFGASPAQIKQENSESSSGSINTIPRHNSTDTQSSNSRHTSTTSISPSTGNIGVKGDLPASDSMQSFAGLFSPSVLNGASGQAPDYGFPRASQSPASSRDNGTNTNSGIERVFRFNSESALGSVTESPSASSSSQWNATSSCGTSPSASHPSPPKDPSTVPTPTVNGKAAPKSNANTNEAPSNGINWMASQNGNQFDPLLFGDYRESQDAIVGDGEFNNGFFNEAFPIDFASPLNFSDPKSPQPPQKDASAPAPVKEGAAEKSVACTKLLEQVARAQAGEEPSTAAPGANGNGQDTLLTANTIWNQLQQNKDFKDGVFDLDGLCSELRTKAKCSESGVAIPADHVAEAFKKIGGSGGNAAALDEEVHQMTFDPGHVNEAVSKLGGDKIDWASFGLSDESSSLAGNGW